MKKVAVALLAMVMVLAMAVPAMAVKITIDDGSVTGAEYAAYKLLNVTYAAGTEQDSSDDKYAYTLNSKYTTVLQGVTGKTTEDEIVAYIGGLNDDRIREFADEAYAAIKTAGIAADYTTKTNEFTSVDQGYYLIVETKLGSVTGGGTDSYSLHMLDTANKDVLEVKTKESVPTVDKQVQEKNDSTGTSSWGDSADYDVGDTIEYKITGTVSDKYENYQSYYYSFSDTMDAGLTLDKNSIKVTVGTTDVTSQFTITKEDHSFTATANLKELTGVTINANTQIVVTYKAKLNESAVVGSTGNKNKVALEYENNPYHEGDGDPTTPDKPDEPGKTPEDVNIVFTYDVVVNKVDEDGNKLAGAGFTLYKWNASSEEEDKWETVGSEITGVTEFEFEKLDAGKYKLVETTVPVGHNKADDIVFEIVSTLEGIELKTLVVKDADGNVISSGTGAIFTVTLADGNIATDVINTTGTRLPNTGGMGTTLFYVVGSLLVVGAAVVLLARKRRRE